MSKRLRTPLFAKRLEDLGQDITPPDQQTAVRSARITSEIEKWWPLIKTAGIQVRVTQVVARHGALLALRDRIRDRTSSLRRASGCEVRTVRLLWRTNPVPKRVSFVEKLVFRKLLEKITAPADASPF